MSDKRTWKYEPEDGNEVAFIGEYDGERMIRFVCEFIDPPSAEDAALMIAAKNSTHPADAALAALLRNLEIQSTNNHVAKDKRTASADYCEGIAKGFDECLRIVNQHAAILSATDAEGRKDGKG